MIGGCAQIIGADWKRYEEDTGGNIGGNAGGGIGGGIGGGAGGDTEPLAHFDLSIDDSRDNGIDVEINKTNALNVFGESAAQQIRLFELDTTALLQNIIDQIQDACGSTWRSNSPDPGHDCTLTPLGQTFGLSWRSSPQFALVRLLTMTPANARVTGTSLESVKAIFDDNPGTFSFDLPDVLAASLGIARTDTFVPTNRLIIALQQHLLGTHPEIGNVEGTLPITLHDALHDLTPLASKLSPVGSAPWADVGEHAGVLVPDDRNFKTQAALLLPEFFRMHLTAGSNLRWVSGLDLSRGAGHMLVSDSDAPVRLDFTNPNTFIVTGIANYPTIDLRFAISELMGAVRTCDEEPACQSNYPPPTGTPVGMDTIWTIAPFLLEPIIAKSAFLTYEHRELSTCFFILGDMCRFGIDVGQNGTPTGWSVLTNRIALDGMTADAPKPQFLWELVTEVAQVAIHDSTGDGSPDLEEGAIHPAYTLRGVGIGPTGEQIAANIRATLQSQGTQIAQILRGPYWEDSDALDFFYSRSGPEGDACLFFVAESDRRPEERNRKVPRPYEYESPGFFNSPDLREESKVSSKSIPLAEDRTHEKFCPPPGDTTLFIQDDENITYELRLHVDSEKPLELAVDVKRLSP
ncbi:hypothetical protein [Sorangium sp. So ce1153]|uniref:hypothetical protein n=1 Tax=Sorangium sp. So ce1153 TaxID=3133333 RepID=UPI003F622739